MKNSKQAPKKGIREFTSKIVKNTKEIKGGSIIIVDTDAV